jgi:hypothetical protein
MTTRRTEEEVDNHGRRTALVEEEHQERDAHAHGVSGSDEVVKSTADPWFVTQGFIRMLASLLAVALVAVETLLGFRFAFLLAGANASNGFVDFIYDASGWIVEPFEGIADPSSVDGGGVFDPATLIAMAVVGVAGILILMTLWAISSAPATSSEHRTTRTRHDTTSVHED